MATKSPLRRPASAIEVSRPFIFGAGVLALLLGVAGWRISEDPHLTEVPFEAKTKPPQAAPLCPWREPESDLKLLFADATHYELETCILSGLRLELTERLGRAPTGDENILHIHRVYREKTPLGVVLTRRVKGAYGAIELVLAVSTNGQMRGLRLQRLREPEPIAVALQNPDWLGAFAGLRVGNTLQLGHDLPKVPAEARASADAVIEGARSLLILLAAADEARSGKPAVARHH
jgi:hypothetical protein